MAAAAIQAAQLSGAQAALQQSRINVDYTEIRAPIDGEIGRTAITPGNVVSPSSGPLAMIVSQDPMYVTFPVAVRLLTDLRTRYEGAGRAERGAGQAETAGRLAVRPDRQDRLRRSVGLRRAPIRSWCARRSPIPSAARRSRAGGSNARLIDGAFVTVLVEGIQPVTALGIPRAAVMSDQSGNLCLSSSAPTTKSSAAPSSLGQSTADAGRHRRED